MIPQIRLFAKVIIAKPSYCSFQRSLKYWILGQTGDWKNHFSPEVNRKIDAWIDKNLAGTGLKFVTELKDQ